MNPSRSGEGDTKIVVITEETPEYVYKLLTEYLSNADKVQISTTGLENIKNNVDELFCTEELANDYIQQNQVIPYCAKMQTTMDLRISKH